MASAAPSAVAPGDGLSMPASLHGNRGTASTGPRHIKDWASSFVGRQRSRFGRTGGAAAADQTAPRTPPWWKVRLFRGMVNDIRRRAPFYWSDWVDAWNYRVVPATVYMYFAKYEPPLRRHLLSSHRHACLPQTPMALLMSNVQSSICNISRLLLSVEICAGSFMYFVSG